MDDDRMIRELRDYMLECYLCSDFCLILNEPEFKLLLRQVKDLCFELENMEDDMG